MRRIALALLVALAIFAAGQEDQTPRPLRRDAKGLLQVNRDFYDLAASTGGDFYFWAPGEFASANLQIPLSSDEVLLAYGPFRDRRVFEIPVESSVRTLTVFAGAQRKDLAVLVRPDGTVVHERDAGVSLQSFQHMLIATIDSPAAGVWRLELHGEGLYSVSAHVKPADDGPALVDFDRKSCEATVRGAAKFAVEFVAKDGSLLPHDGCVLPEVPFRVAVSGADTKGRPFRRIERPLQAAR